MGSSVILPSPGQPRTGPDPAFRSATIPKLVSFGITGIDPPSSLYIERDDVLGVDVASINANDTVTITVRLLVAAPDQPGQPGMPSDVVAGPGPGKTQTIKVVKQVVNASAAVRNLQQTLIPLAEGYPLSVVATANTSSTDRGGLWVRCYINRGAAAPSDLNAMQVLFADYVTFQKPVGWPGGRQLSTTEGPGNIRTVAVANPGAGVDWTVTVPVNARWLVHAFDAQLQTAAAVANRIARVQVTDGASLIWQAPPSQVVTAGTTAQVSGTAGQVTSTADPATVNVALPTPAILNASGVLRVSTTNLQAADQWSNIAIEVEEWLLNV